MCGGDAPDGGTPPGCYFAAFFLAAHRFFWASEILRLALALILRLPL